MSASEISTVRVAVIGAGLMGREVASAFGRWFAILDSDVRPELVGVCDVNPEALKWFLAIPGVRHFETDPAQLLRHADIDVVYVAVPHHLHESLYLDVLRTGKDLFAEKPFGIDLPSARRVRDEAARLGRFVRISSEFPFLPGALRALNYAREGHLGRPIEARCAFLHSSDLDPNKPINWKRQSRFCGEAGVMNDLGMHVAHLPLRLGWKPDNIFATLQRVHTQRPDGKGGMAASDTWDNATVRATATIQGESVPLCLEMKRLAPGETNTWIFELFGTDGGVRFSTKEPKSFWTFQRGSDQLWQRTDLGFATPFKTITGGIFEPGFPDILQQMWAAFFAERKGTLGARVGCATPDEAVAQHELWTAALKSVAERRSVTIAEVAS